jgi:hypothetical protein
MSKLIKIYLVNNERLKNLPLESLTKGFITEYDFRFIFGSNIEQYGQVRYYLERKLFSISISKTAVDDLTDLALEGLIQHEIIDGLGVTVNLRRHNIYRKDETEIDNVATKVYEILSPIVAFRCETLKLELNENSEKTKKNFLDYLAYLSAINPELKNEIEKQTGNLFNTD